MTEPIWIAGVGMTVFGVRSDASVKDLTREVVTEAIGARLRALRAEGVLVIGSGFLTHHGSMSVGQADLMPYNVDFDAWAADALDRGAIDELFAWTDRAPAARLAHPTPDQFIPLFVTLGAADNPAATVQTTITGGLFGNSKRSFQVD